MHFLWKKINLYYNQKRIAVCLVLYLLAGCVAGAGDFGNGLVAKAAESKVVSMTELSAKGNWESGLAAGAIVTIESKEELELFRQYVDSGNSLEYVTFRQTADIVMSDYTFQYDEKSSRTGFYLEGELLGTVSSDGCVYENYTTTDETTLELQGIANSEQKSWNPIGNSDSEVSNVFNGSYDGNGYSISGLWCVSKENNVGLFSYVKRENVYNVTLKNSLFVGANHVGGIAGTLTGASAVITNCSVQTIIMGAERCGGIVGYLYGGYGYNANINDDTIVKNCVVQGVIQGDNVGGCVGYNDFGEISYCKFVGEKSKVVGESGISGGVVGRVSLGKVSNCENYGIVQGNTAGGITGIMSGNSLNKGIWQCINYGEVKGDTIGGIAGSLSEVNCYRCINYGTFYESAAGGIAGQCYENVWIVDCENRGDFFEIDKSAGGITNYLGENSEIQNCINYGDFYLKKGYWAAGGIFVGHDEGVLVQNCVNLGDFIGISDTKNDMIYLGNIGGYLFTGTIKNCYYPQGEVSCVGNEDAVLQSCYPVTGSQIRGTEKYIRICEEKGNYAYTTSLVEALNNAVKVINQLNMGKEEKKEISMQNWMLGEDGLPTICNIGVGEPVEEPEITIPPYVAPPVTMTAISAPTPQPTATANPTESPVVTITMTTISSPTPQPTAVINYQNQKVTGFKATAKAPKKVKLSWNPVESATGYEIYRSTKKKSGYKLVQAVEEKTDWNDKGVKRGKKYFYKICATIGTGPNLVQGKMSAVKKVKLPWYATPKVAYQKGVTPDNTRYLTIRLKKYQGTHVEILAKTKKGKFKKIPLSDSDIKKNRGTFGLSYSKKSGVLYCKVRTFRYVKKKKRYSLYTKVKKIRL